LQIVNRQYLEEQLAKDYKLLKRLEDKLRLEDDPKRQAKLELDIDEMNQRIGKREARLKSLGNEQYSETTAKLSQESSTDLDNLIEVGIYPKTDTNESAKDLISLLSLVDFCTYTFPLLRWMYQPVPANHVDWYFHKIHEFFMLKGEHIPQKGICGLDQIVECFFRCAYVLPSADFEAELREIKGSGKLKIAYKLLVEFCRERGYTISSISLNPENQGFSSSSLITVLTEFKRILNHLLHNKLKENKALTPAERDILLFMIFVIDFLFKENRARKNGKQLDLPEGIVVKLQDVLNYAFEAHLGVKLPKREDVDELSNFPSYVWGLIHCWNDDSGEFI
jgi:hypothetical protein